MADGVNGVPRVSTSPDWFGRVMVALAVLVVAATAGDLAFVPQVRGDACVPGSDLSVVLAGCLAAVPVLLVSLFGLIFSSRRRLLAVAAVMMLVPGGIGLVLLSMMMR